MFTFGNQLDCPASDGLTLCHCYPKSSLTHSIVHGHDSSMNPEALSYTTIACSHTIQRLRCKALYRVLLEVVIPSKVHKMAAR